MARPIGGLRRADDRRTPLPGATSQREMFRASLEDAVDGVDVIELQTGRPLSVAPVRTAASGVVHRRSASAEHASEHLRASLQDAIDGVDIVELQTGRQLPAPTVRRAVLQMHPHPELVWSPVEAEAEAEGEASRPSPAAILPLPTAPGAPEAPPPAAPASRPPDAALAQQVIAPLLSELAALRAEVHRLQGLPAEVNDARRRDLLTVSGALLIALGVTVLVLVLALRG